ncbi:MAG: universal stress protein [Agitococcus sp.]
MKRFKNILYVVETNVNQDNALAKAVTLAETNQAQLTVMEVIPRISMTFKMQEGDIIDKLIISQHQQYLQQLIAPYVTRLTIDTRLLVGSTYLEVIRAVLSQHYDLVIKAAENPDFLERLFGATDMHLLRKCPCPLWLISPLEQHQHSQQNIMAAIDFDPIDFVEAEQTFNHQILDVAASIAVADLSSLHIVHAWQAVAESLVSTWAEKSQTRLHDYIEQERLVHQQGLDALAMGLRQRITQEVYDYLVPKCHLVKGDARKLIPALSHNLAIDLVVMGSVARTGIAGLIIGNTAETILEQLQCSVLVLKPQGFISPVTLAN